MSGYQYTITLATTADGTYETGLIDQNHNKCDFRVAFYNSSGAIVTPTAGTVTPTMQLLPGQWMAPGTGDVSVDATKCGAAATYSLPVFNTSATKGRIVLSGITGTDIAKVVAVFTVGM
ncbi:hypothetical protein KB2_gp052 [Klebsiella phage vB_KleM_KB2]|jgi:hypothetical protein|uniref:DUF7265 domain-containing protein n=1 Tax=Klebsiella phage vB_KleM_KB2 TaxID=2759197 RepID=A0AAE7J160_9CAUD|nr:hypothetical protein PQZ66_gp69 [Klebsiella phage vB_KleM_KB2]QNI20529.1 hypothetical protein KB2_gp052 [Klebsiella phage vB_KleM_KB2]DAK72450.1 MAG TPA: hypothetical protein [Caudoviricetes sp.]